MKTTTGIRLFELFRTKFPEDESKEMVGSIKSLTHDGLAERLEARIVSSESRILSTLTWRLLMFFIAQVGFTVAIVKFIVEGA